MNLKKREVIIKAKVDYRYNSNVPDRKIKKDHYVGKKETSTQELETDLIFVLKEKLPLKMKEIYGIDVKIDIKKIEYGSISIFFGAIFQGIQIVASYKSFIDSVRLIREHAQDLIEHLMNEKYGKDFSIDVDIKYPRLERHDHIDDFLYLGKKGRKILSFDEESNNCKRDAFFWFLLCMNIVLISVVGAMSYAAIAKTYFTP